MFVCPIITHEPLDQFASNFDWGTRENHGIFLNVSNYKYTGQRLVIIFVGNVNTLGVQDRVEFLNPEIIHFSSTSRKHTQTTIKLCGIIQNAEAGILR